VISVTDLTPWYRRVEFAGHGLLPRLTLAPASYLLLHVPSLDAEAGRGVERGYTIVQPDVATDRFSLDFVLHEPAGPASAWAAAAAVGTTVAVSDPPYHLDFPETLEHALLIGDSAAAPALDTLARHLPLGTRITLVLVDAHTDADRVPFVDRDGLAVHRLPVLTTDWLQSLSLNPATDWLWAAGERSLAKLVRSHARDWAFPRDRQHIQTYWIARD
jgi:ATP-binding cassette subfamily B protein IrtA